MVEVGMMNSNINFHAFETKEELVKKFANQIAFDLRESIIANGRATLIVSGGSTPKALFETLRERDIDWEKVTVGLCDERWVDVSHDDSNEKLVKTLLLQGKASKANFVGMYHDKESALVCDARVRESLYPFDVVILGMGADGHTASLFPHNPQLEEGFDLENKNLCIMIEPTTAPHTRMSLTRSAILSAKHLYLHFEGEEKLAVYKEALAGEDMYTMPIRAFLHQDQKDLEVYYA